MADEKNKSEEKPKKVAVACGHENKHYVPPAELAGKKLTCTQEKGHQPILVRRTGAHGDKSTYEIVHSAPYKRLKGGVLVDDIAYWGDAAGIPIPE